MTIQLPALAVRASFIATIAAVLVAAMVMTGRADAASGPGTPVLAQGAGMGAKPSVQVRRVQRALQRRGYDVGAPGVDGRFGPLTAAAVRRLQAARAWPSTASWESARARRCACQVAPRGPRSGVRTPS